MYFSLKCFSHKTEFGGLKTTKLGEPNNYGLQNEPNNLVTVNFLKENEKQLFYLPKN